MVSLIADETHDARRNLAVDEAVARATRTEPAFRLCRHAACVVVGRSQRVEREVDLAACAADRLPVLRRASGGGTVYTDLGTINASLVRPGSDSALPALIDILVDALERLGLAVTRGERGLFAARHKLSGFAELRTTTACLAHATVLVHTPNRVVGRYLTPTPADSHPLDSQRRPVTSLRALGLECEMTPVHAALVAAARRRLGPLTHRRLSPWEGAWLEDLLEARYADPAWHLATGAQGRDSQRRRAWTVASASRSTARWC